MIPLADMVYLLIECWIKMKKKLIKKRIMIRWKERNLAADLDSYL